MRHNILIIVFIALLNISGWLVLHQRPHMAADISYPFASISFEPNHPYNHNPERPEDISEEQLEEDFKKIAGKTRCVRIYRPTNGMEKVPEIAQKYNMTVIAGTWFDGNNAKKNQREFDALMQMVNDNSNITHLLIGNEIPFVRMQKEQEEELIDFVLEAKKRTDLPVSTARTKDAWLDDPDLAQYVDFIPIHIIPYWYGISNEQAVESVLESYEVVKKAFPGKPVMIAEVGWPSLGAQRGESYANKVSQAQFIRDFIASAQKESLFYNIVEAFDQPWKLRHIGGRADSHFGIMTPQGREKFPLSGPIFPYDNWLAVFLSTFLGLMVNAVFLYHHSDINLKGRLFAAIIIQFVMTFITVIGGTIAAEYMLWFLSVWLLIIPALILLFTSLLVRTFETAEVIGDRPLKRNVKAGVLKSSKQPFVSIHVACRNEPPQIVIETAKHLLDLDYPAFEVLVIDNNTEDEALWLPVQEFVEKSADNIRFHHLENWPGFKAGALNYGLGVADPQAEIIAVVDADYIVEKNWLSETIPFFEDDKIAVVQAPQSYRDYENSKFQSIINDEYRGFFSIGMVQRNEYNAIIQHGTMTLIRKSVLMEVGQWSEWSICEDTELGLRILEAGYEKQYVNKVFGRGLIPYTFSDYAKQRVRWSFGAVRIILRHWKELLGLKGTLTFRQRYHFLSGWIPWIGDGLYPFFTLFGIAGASLIIWNPRYFPPSEFLFPIIIYLVLTAVMTVWTQKKRLNITNKQVFLSLIAGASLTGYISMGVIKGFIRLKQPFHRTGKTKEVNIYGFRFLLNTKLEMALVTTMAILAGCIIFKHGFDHSAAVTWCIILFILSIPNFAVIFMKFYEVFRNES